MRRMTIVLASLLVTMASAAIPAAAEGHGPPHLHDPHPHVLLLGVDAEFPEIGPPIVNSYERCVDLAHSRSLPKNNHHWKLHFGTAGGNLSGKAGILVAPYTCESLPF